MNKLKIIDLYKNFKKILYSQIYYKTKSHTYYNLSAKKYNFTSIEKKFFLLYYLQGLELQNY